MTAKIVLQHMLLEQKINGCLEGSQKRLKQDIVSFFLSFWKSLDPFHKNDVHTMLEVVRLMSMGFLLL